MTAARLVRKGWVALAGLAFVPWSTWYFVPRLPDRAWAPWAVAVAVVVTGLALIWIVALLRWRAVLEADAIRMRGLGGERVLARGEIAGLRRGKLEGEPWLMLEPRDAALSVMSVEALADEPGFARWLAGIADLDGRGGPRAVAVALAQPVLGEVADEGQSNLTHQGQADRWLMLGGSLLTAWVVFWPAPYRAAIAAAAAVLPLLAMGAVAWRLQGWRWRIEGEGSGGLVIATVAPAVALAMRASVDLDLVWPWTPAPIALAAGFVAGVLTLMAMAPGRLRRRRRGARLAPVAGAAVAVAVAMGCWTYGALIYENAWGPGQSPTEAVPLTVTAHEAAQDGARHTLAVEAWQALDTPQAAKRLSLASRPAQDEVAVTADTWAAAARGQAVCAYVREGARGWPIIDYGACPPPKPWRKYEGPLILP
ncbi:MAG: hypothetical protein JWP35_3153 [Caulobacter sp.]|nr:hypothetical protein [Caulobacter sp.]